MNRLRLKEKKKKRIIIISLFALVMLLGTSYAFFTYRRSKEAFSLTSNQIKAEFTSGTNEINFTNAYPISDEYALANLDKLDYIDFTVSSLSSSDTDTVQYEIYLTENTGNTLDSKYIKVYLTDDNGNKVIDPTLYSDLEYTTYEEDSTTGKVVYEEINGGKIVKNYRLYIWLDSEYSQNEVSQTFGFKVNLYAYNVIDNTLFTRVKSQMIGTSDDIDFNVSSQYAENTYADDYIYTNKAGVFKWIGDSNTFSNVYFYRGSVDNNNVIFGGFCWLILRTTETQGVKLIYNGVPTDGVCNTSGSNTEIGKSVFNTSYNDAKYVGYTYDVDGVETNSTIKTYLENWYSTNMTSYTSKLEDTEFCNDRSIVSSTDEAYSNIYPIGSSYTFFGISARTSYYTKNVSPSLVCTNESDKYSIANSNITYPVGLITLDELALGGATSGYDTAGASKSDDKKYNYSSNGDNVYYLNNGSYYWTISPVVFGASANVGRSHTSGDLVNSVVISSYIGVRAVVSLASNAMITSGDGTSSTPYVIN